MIRPNVPGWSIALPADEPTLAGARLELSRYGTSSCSPTTPSTDHADDRTLVTLLHLRDIEAKLEYPYSIITEMNDDLNREVAQVTRADDFIVSNKLISLLITQLAENRRLGKVFAELFDPSQSEIYLKPAHAYLKPDVTANFTVVESARRRGETAIGYRTAAQADELGHGVINSAR
jgi:hypothetical protein